MEEPLSILGTSNLLEDAKFYQDTASEYQNAYESLQHRYTQQAHLVEEASLHAAESQTSQKHQELLNLQRNCEADIQTAVSKVVIQYKEQLSMAKHNLQSKDHEDRQVVQKLQGQVHALELSLASQANLPSVGHSQDGADLQEEVFNYLLGTVNTNWGAALYKLQDQAFPFQKHVQFGDRSQVPDLKLDTNPSNHPSPSHTIPHSSTPHHGVKLLNRTFYISQISPLTGNPHDAVTIAAEVLAAAAAQVSKKFHHMCDPKITKFKGSYSTDAKLTLWSWCTDILIHIQDCELDNKAAIQLIKDMILENACHEVEFQLDLCGGIFTYQDLLKHLSITFQGGDDETNLLAEFYSHGQKSKESEEAFADEL